MKHLTGTNIIKEKKSVNDWKVKISFALFLCFLIINCFIGMNMAKEKDFVVVIDAGHGGNDPGKVSVDGIQEKDINLEIAKRVKIELQARGIKVVMTREDDQNLSEQGVRNQKNSDLTRRVEIIRESKGTCVVSIHQNSYPDPSVSGPQVFYYSSSEDSKNLGQIIQKKIINGLNPDKKRQIKKGDDYYILRKSKCPGVIVECGFLSSPKEKTLLQNPEYQQILARMIAQGICDYLRQ